MRYFLFLVLWHLSFVAWSQISGKVSLPYAGLEFIIPEGWVGQETESGYLLGSNSEAGAIFLSGHENSSLESLKQEAMRGIQEEGMILRMEGEPRIVRQNGIAGSYSGSLQGQAVEGYAVGLINPYGGGVSVLVLTTPEMFMERHRQLVDEIAATMRFFQAEKAPIVDEWKQALTNARLTYMESYSSQGDGYSDKVVIELCSAGYFKHSKRYNMGIDTGGASASDHNASQGSGSWDVVQDASGNPVLQLNFSHGEVMGYTLQYVNEKTLLNGRRYFRTYDAGCN